MAFKKLLLGEKKAIFNPIKNLWLFCGSRSLITLLLNSKGAKTSASQFSSELSGAGGGAGAGGSPPAAVVVADGDPGVVGDDVGADGLDGLGVGLHPAHPGQVSGSTSQTTCSRGSRWPRRRRWRPGPPPPSDWPSPPRTWPPSSGWYLAHNKYNFDKWNPDKSPYKESKQFYIHSYGESFKCMFVVLKKERYKLIFYKHYCFSTSWSLWGKSCSQKTKSAPSEGASLIFGSNHRFG